MKDEPGGVGHAFQRPHNGKLFSLRTASQQFELVAIHLAHQPSGGNHGSERHLDSRIDPFLSLPPARLNSVC